MVGNKNPHYPKPRAVGGRLIRQVVTELRRNGVTLPIDSHILIATSSGSDSVALAHLLAKYGRRVVAPSQLELLHVNHGWRGAESDADARFVRELGRKLKLPVTVRKLKPPAKGLSSETGASLEDTARNERQEVFESLAKRKKAIVLTAHQAEDVAETLLWRLFTGAAKTHGGAIAVRHGAELRPLLTIRKADLQAYLREEEQSWREDSTNHAGRFMRSRMRIDLFPTIERLFPRAVEHLVELALTAQRREVAASPVGESECDFIPLISLFAASGLRLRRPHWEALEKQMRRTSRTEIHLAGGWRIIHDPGRKTVRWTLEKTK